MSDKLERYNALIKQAVELLWPEFEGLTEKAAGLLESDPGAEQVIALKTAGGNIYGFTSHADLNAWDDSEGLTFLNTLAEKGEERIEYLVCFMNSAKGLPPEIEVVLQPELPSYGFRRRMLELDGANAETVILLQGGIMLPKKLKATMPPEK